ncbi:MAG: protein kinase [Blastocatellia bacterium]|nr:protein kinase [Blastocatellia bacterium]
MNRHSILIVDDDKLILEMLSIAFKKLDCDVITAENGQEGLQKVIDLKPSIIISDWHMPELDGLGMFLQVKRSPHTKHIPFVFLTTTDDPEVRAALLEIGVEDYWTKPFNIREVAVRAKKLLERVDMMAQLNKELNKERETIRLNPLSAEDHLTEMTNGRYKIISQIGSGGMGIVYKAHDLKYDCDVAIKLLRAEYISDESAMRRFAREAAAATRIIHPNVIRTYEYGIIPNGQAYISMELLSGSSLDIELEKTPIIPLKRALNIMYQTCLGIEASHKQGVIHRDLKTNNIFLIDTVEKTDQVKVLDFGIAILANTPDHARITDSNSALGTPLYISPEQITGGQLDHRSDIYSLGVVFYEMLAGIPPFDGTIYELLLCHGHKTPVHIKTFANIEDTLAELVMRMLAKSPSERPDSAEEIAEVIKKVGL